MDYPSQALKTLYVLYESGLVSRSGKGFPEMSFAIPAIRLISIL